MGSGKTTISKELHKNIKNTVLINLDSLKYFLSGYEMDSKKHLEFASGIARLITRECLKKEINVIAEKAFTRSEILKKFIGGLERNSRLFIYQLDSSLSERINRIRKRPVSQFTGKKIPISKITRNSKNFQRERYKKAREFNTTKMSIKEIVKEIMGDIK